MHPKILEIQYNNTKKAMKSDDAKLADSDVQPG